VDAYPDPWQPDDYTTRNIFLAASLSPRREGEYAKDPVRAKSLSKALLRSRPADVAVGRILTDDAAPLEPLVRHTAQRLRNRTRGFIPVDVLIR
jgi:hypothetical protein